MSKEIDQLKEQVDTLENDKNRIIEKLLQRLTLQEKQLQTIVTNKQNQSLINIEIKQLIESGSVFQNFSTHKKYLLLDISDLGKQDKFIYQKQIKIAKNDTETWDNAIMIKLKQKLNHTNSYCQMLLSDLQTMDRRIEILQNEVDKYRKELTHQKQQSMKKSTKNKSVQKSQNVQTPNKGSKQKTVQKQSPQNKKKDWNNLFPVFEENSCKHDSTHSNPENIIKSKQQSSSVHQQHHSLLQKPNNYQQKQIKQQHKQQHKQQNTVISQQKPIKSAEIENQVQRKQPEKGNKNHGHSSKILYIRK